MTLRTHRHFETTAPVVITCSRCMRPVIYGLAEGIRAVCDVQSVDPDGEAAAVAAGRTTYTIRRFGLIQRDTGRRTDPALASPVLAEHACPRPA